MRGLLPLLLLLVAGCQLDMTLSGTARQGHDAPVSRAYFASQRSLMLHTELERRLADGSAHSVAALHTALTALDAASAAVRDLDPRSILAAAIVSAGLTREARSVSNWVVSPTMFGSSGDTRRQSFETAYSSPELEFHAKLELKLRLPAVGDSSVDLSEILIISKVEFGAKGDPGDHTAWAVPELGAALAGELDRRAIERIRAAGSTYCVLDGGKKSSLRFAWSYLGRELGGMSFDDRE